MNQRTRTNRARKRRGFTYLWIAALAVSIFLLIYFEQTALLYILATLGVTVLLVIVAFTDLGSTELSSDTVGHAADAASPLPDAKPRR